MAMKSSYTTPWDTIPSGADPAFGRLAKPFSLEQLTSVLGSLQIK
jgi:hypothetical protein